ncbi:MAG: prepilin-type N-terminal cleavage/methylation domain-containing protein [Planctomycetales bacterium]
MKRSEVRGQRSEVGDHGTPHSELRIPHSARRGLTLFEVIVALAILLGSMAVLGQLISTGSRAAVRTDMHTRATLLCQAKLAEVLSGAVPLQPVEGMPVDEFTPDWLWGLEVLPGPHPDLLVVAVTVSHVDPERASDSTETLYRYMRRPNLFQEWSDATAEADAAAAGTEAAP